MYPLSQSQLGIYFTCQHLNETTGNYQMCFLYRLTPTINLKQLKRSLEAVVAEHSYIASRISISSNGIPTLEQGKTVFKAKIQKIKSIVEVRSTFCRTMNLDEEQLFRAEIYETENGNFLYLDFHHIIMDGMSLGMFMSELEKAYAGEALQREEKDGFTIALDEVALRESEKYEEARQWYEKKFAGAIDLESTPLPDLYD
ncbi:MAG: condensation domain-containing protein, partial [Bacteroidales bacterium]|nr:condensation domain-containing protein [Bacteroidales bacterium]